LTLWNSYSFFVTYASLDGFKPSTTFQHSQECENVLDKWLLSKTRNLISHSTQHLEKYELASVTRLISVYMDGLSNWYIRRSRKRFWKSENDVDKNSAYETLYYALVSLTKVLAPFMPFVTDEIYRNLTGEASVHLSDWPKINEKLRAKQIEEGMDLVKQIVELGLSARNEKGIKVRQPLAKLSVSAQETKLPEELVKIIAEEVNVKKVEFKKAKVVSVKLDTKITTELRAEGIARDFVRAIQEGRKKAGFNVEDRIKTHWMTGNSELANAIKSQQKYIAKETLSVEFNEGNAETQYSETIKFSDVEVWFGITRAKK
jgi:isoleucyl-tRNA synthetase